MDTWNNHSRRLGSFVANNDTNMPHVLSSNINNTPDAWDGNFTSYNNESYSHDNSSSDGRDIIHRIIVPIICTFGIVGIIVTIVVLSRKNMCTTTNCYLVALASADLMFLIILTTTLGEYLFKRNDSAFYRYAIYVPFATIFMQIFLMSSIWLTVVLAMERYLAICRPFYVPHICSIFGARVIIVIIYISAFICRMPNFWEYKIMHAHDIYYITLTDFALSHHYQTVYHWIVDVVFTTILPFLFLLILNFRLIWEVRKSTAYIQRNLIVTVNKANLTAQKEELQITIMLISIVLVFFICQFPYVMYTAIVSTHKFQLVSSGFMMFRYVAMMMLSLKAALNFILYCWFSEKFWVTLKRIFCMRQCSQISHNYSDLTNGSLYSLRRRSSAAATRDTSLATF